MSFQTEAVTVGVPVRDAATVMLVRDASAGGIEVLMLRRSLDSDFVGGAWVFPGGAVDPGDHLVELEPHCAGPTDRSLAFRVAAVRECFEEAGLLLAYAGDGTLLRFDDPEVDRRFVAHRRDVDAGRTALVDVCRAEGISLAVDAMAFVARWVTPVGLSRRYDTRFFVAAAPEGQVPLHDDRETIEHVWIGPREALDRAASGSFELVLPTVRSLETIEGFVDVGSLLAHAATIDDVETITPEHPFALAGPEAG